MSQRHRPAQRQAEQALDRADRSTDPQWLSYFDEAYLSAKFGHCFHALGRNTHAERFAARSLRMNDRFVRGKAFNLALLANIHAHQGQPERACASGAQLDVHPRVAMQILRHARFSVAMEIYTQATSTATRDALKRPRRPPRRLIYHGPEPAPGSAFVCLNGRQIEIGQQPQHPGKMLQVVPEHRLVVRRTAQQITQLRHVVTALPDVSSRGRVLPDIEGRR